MSFRITQCMKIDFLILDMFYLYYLWLLPKKCRIKKKKVATHLRFSQYTLISLNKVQVLRFTCGPMTDI